LLSEWEETGRCMDAVMDGSSDKQGGFTTEMVSQYKSGASATGSTIKHFVVATDAPPA